jgi:hypothetical protein
MTASINTMVEFTKTVCAAVASEDPKKYSFILASEKPVFSNEKTKKAWVLMAAVSAGYSLNEHSKIQAKEIILADASTMTFHKGYALPATTAKEIQSKIKSEELTLDQAYAKALAGMTEKDMLP